MSNKYDRDEKEVRNLLDPKYARQFWRSVGNAIANRPAVKPIAVVDKDGNYTKESEIELNAFQRLANDLKILNSNRTEPTELEMLMQSQFILARTNPSAAIFVRDTLGVKPVDESKVDNTINEYSGLSDEELELIAELREAKKREALQAPADSIVPCKPALTALKCKNCGTVSAITWSQSDRTPLEERVCEHCQYAGQLEVLYEQGTGGMLED